MHICLFLALAMLVRIFRAVALVLRVVTGMTSKTPHLFLYKLSREYSSKVFRLPLPIFSWDRALPRLCPVFCVSDYTVASQILRDPFSDKPREIYSSFEGIVGRVPVMFTSGNSRYVRSIRKLYHTAFGKQHCYRIDSVLDKHVNSWLNTSLRGFAVRNEAFDPVDETLSVMFSALTEICFDYPATREDYHILVDHLEEALQEFAYRRSTNPLREAFGRWLPRVRRSHESAAPLVNLAHRMLKHAQFNSSHDATFIRDLLEHVPSDDQRVAEIVMMLAAGHDTTGSYISNILVLLAKHTKVQTRVREELVVGGDRRHQSTTYGQVIRWEANRCVPVACMGSTRQTGRDYTFGRVHIPKGSICFLPQHLYFHDPNIFPTPDEFQPDRWNKPSSDMIESYIPFSIGMRSCLGQALALSMIDHVVRHVLTKFELELVDEGRLDYLVIQRRREALIRIHEIDNVPS